MDTSNQDNPLSRIPNPFRGNVYTDAWREMTSDVSSINATAFSTLWDAFDRARAQEGNASVLLSGDPGTGKTHLLGRLRKRLASSAVDAPDGAVAAVFTHLQLSSNPDAVWRQLRRALTNDLMHEVEGMTQLQRIVAHELAAFTDIEPAKMVRLLSKYLRENPDLIHRAIDHMCGRLDIPDETATVIEHLVQRRMVRDARAWLRGDYLPPRRREAIGVNPEPDVESEESEARDVVIALSSISPRTLPMILCFDQIEAIERFPRDDAALFTFGRVVSDLYNEGRNLLLISCIQSGFMERLSTALGGADFDRVAERQTALKPLTSDESAALLRARMDTLPELSALRAEHGREALWPLERSHLDSADDGFPDWTPRRLLASATRWFEEAAARPLTPPVEVPDWLEAQFEARADTMDPALARDILLHGLPQVCSLQEVDWEIDRSPLPKDVALRMVRAEDAVDVVLLNDPKMQGVWRPLKRLKERQDTTRVVILREARHPIPASAAKTNQYLEELQQRGARVVWIRAEALAALDAARSLLAAARAGDLSTDDGETVPVETVADWLAAHLNDRLAPVASLFNELVGGPVQLNRTLERIKEAVDRERVVEASALARELAIDIAEVERLSRLASGAFGLLDGPPLVLFALRARPRAAATTTDEVQP